MLSHRHYTVSHSAPIRVRTMTAPRGVHVARPAPETVSDFDTMDTRSQRRRR